MGLNAIELYDTSGERVAIAPQNVMAHPHSVNVCLEENAAILEVCKQTQRMCGDEDLVLRDARVPANLVRNLNPFVQRPGLGEVSGEVSPTGNGRRILACSP